MNDFGARAYYAASGLELLAVDPATILGTLVSRHSFAVEERQRNAWLAEISQLKAIAAEHSDAFFFLEFAIPRMGKRADAIIVFQGLIFVIEYKVGADSYLQHAIDQVVDYSLDLKNFHEGSHHRPVVPVLVATAAPALPVECSIWSDGLLRPLFANKATLSDCINKATAQLLSPSLDALTWAKSAYKPTPTIVEAAQALYRGHAVEEISRSEAGAKNLSVTAAYITKVVDDARSNKKKSICFVTGVPGSGKTLAGLNIATERMREDQSEHAVFLSGNGPLVAVLREALARDEVERSRATGIKGVSKKDAARKASAFIQNIHHFRDDNLKSSAPPSERVVVFDEAQRAWNKESTARFMREKRGATAFDMSEPEYLLSVMDRHHDWCVVVALIGGGQEINTGEAGLAEWFSAIDRLPSQWHVHLSDRLSSADYLGTHPVDPTPTRQPTSAAAALHLSVSVRSFRAEALSEFVREVILGNASAAHLAYNQLGNYPLVLTRHLQVVRNWLHENARGTERIGLVSSSIALRLKPVGIHVKAKIDPCNWFLGPKGDVRSSYALEDVATEFDIQGLELDWVGVCWDANFRRANRSWQSYRFQGARWERVADPARVAYLANAYRVLMTRARQGMIVFVPLGDDLDQTRPPAFYDETYEYLRSCGLPVI